MKPVFLFAVRVCTSTSETLFVTEAAAGSVGAHKPKLGFRKKIVFALVPALVLLFSVEGGLRLAGWPTQRVRTLGKLLNFDPATFERSVGMFEPGVTRTIAWPPELAYEVRINRLGLRGPAVGVVPVPGITRILVLGDSTAFGFYVAEKETFPAHLQDRLTGMGRKVEVVNGGCGGWTITSQLRFYRERAVRLNPALVVLLFCNNDVVELDRPTGIYDVQKESLGRQRNRWRKFLYRTALYELHMRLRISWKRARQKLSGEPPHPLGGGESALPPERLDQLWEEYGQWLARLRDLLAERSTPLLLVYQPDPHRFCEGRASPEEQRLAAICRSVGVPFCSAVPAFEAHRDLKLFHAPLDAHPASAGYRLMAETTSRFLVEQGLLPGDAH
ncbi:SGNH/GDSL hydrolase family protein [Planctomycetota bacterium]